MNPSTNSNNGNGNANNTTPLLLPTGNNSSLMNFSTLNDQQIQSLTDNMAFNFPPGQDIRDIIRLQFSFPTKLYNLLETADPSIVGWLTNGKGFRVHDMDRFITDILPQFFNRKLN
jgi:hypothetical protein